MTCAWIASQQKTEMSNTFSPNKTKIMTKINIFDGNQTKMIVNFSRLDKNYD